MMLPVNVLIKYLECSVVLTQVEFGLVNMQKNMQNLKLTMNLNKSILKEFSFQKMDLILVFHE